MQDHDPTRTYLGRYEICNELGRGGMAAVYRVLDPVSGRFLAAKQLLRQRNSQLQDESNLRFEREFHTLSGLSHPRIIEVYDYTLDAAGPFYTMELLDGGDDFEAAVALMDQVIATQRQLGVTGLMLGASYEARARIAIWARDEPKLSEFGELTAREYRRGARSVLGARYERLMDEARAAFPHRIVAMADTEVGVSGFTSYALQPSAARMASQVLRQATTSSERAAFALSLLCKDRYALGGQLYLATSSGWVCAASQGAIEPSSALDRMAREFLLAELEEPELATRFETDVSASTTTGSPRQQVGTLGVAQPVALSCVSDGEVSHVGVALLVLDPQATPSVVDAQLAGVLAAQLLEAGDACPCSAAIVAEQRGH